MLFAVLFAEFGRTSGFAFGKAPRVGPLVNFRDSAQGRISLDLLVVSVSVCSNASQMNTNLLLLSRLV